MDKRAFIRHSIGILGMTPLINIMRETHDDIYEDVTNDSKWKQIRKDYKLASFINLENGYYSITPQPILKKYFAHIERVNTLGAYYMRTEQFENKERSKNRLAELMGCDKEELAITRNTTESLDLIISGFHWQAGDEAIFANQDYGAMINMFKQVAKRHGIINKIIDVPLNPSNDEEIVSLYEKAITPKTKLMMICHMINITGHILPVKKICDMAHQYGVKVMVDGAHCVAHLDYKISDLNCDFYGASLHKWLSNPLGAGLLYVKKEHIPKLWPLFASGESDNKKIQSLNHTGTLPVYTDLTIPDAIDYYLSIGKKQKEDRLRSLQNYWTDQLRGIKNINIYTPEDKTRSCGIANVGIEYMNPSDLAKVLYDKYNVYTVAINRAGIKGCRITPNVYTTYKELDIFVNAMKDLSIKK